MPAPLPAVRQSAAARTSAAQSSRSAPRRRVGRGLSAAVLGIGLLAGVAVPAGAAPGLSAGAIDRTPVAGPTATPGAYKQLSLPTEGSRGRSRWSADE